MTTIYIDLSQLRELTGTKIFFETGTEYGYGVTKALRNGFEKVYSIEFDALLHKNAKINLDNLVKSDKVVLIKDDSANLKEHITGINQRIVFFLDAHGELDQTKSPCPLFEELEAIRNHPIKDHVILIDDIRIFESGTEWNKSMQITVNSIVTKILNINKNYNISFIPGAGGETDVMIAWIGDLNLIEKLKLKIETNYNTNPFFYKIFYQRGTKLIPIIKYDDLS